MLPAEALKCASIQKGLEHAAKAERVDKVGVPASEVIDRLVSPGVVVVVDSIALNCLQVGLELQQGLLMS